MKGPNSNDGDSGRWQLSWKRQRRNTNGNDTTTAAAATMMGTDISPL
jgi:hypothetical protein